VARRDVERIAGLVDLLAVAEAEADLPVQDVTPVRTVALVARKPLQEGRTVHVLLEGGEADVLPVEHLVPVVDDSLEPRDVRGGLFRRFRHLILLSRELGLRPGG